MNNEHLDYAVHNGIPYPQKHDDQEDDHGIIALATLLLITLQVRSILGKLTSDFLWIKLLWR